jgi:hypothetical protein
MTLLLMIVSLSTSIVIAASVIVRDRRKLWFLQAIATEHGIEHLATAAAAVQTALGGSALTSQLAQQPGQATPGFEEATPFEDRSS